MAADVKARQDRNATIAFTLPISCQICLGKVKQPVLCPNNHVFCSQCMDVWLQRNKQCPSCRVHITPANPVKKIISGLNDCGEDKERLSNPELRKSRFDLLFKEYEEEIQRLESESQLLKTENEVLQQQLQKTGGSKYSGSSRDGSQPRQSDTNGILVLNKKLQDAQKLYEKIKSELSKVKQENNSLKDENVNLNRENQKLRQEIGNRSPHRYGRYTVATLESKVQSYEKEVDQLNKALERSDRFIEELQSKQDQNKEKASGAFSSDGDFAYPSKPVRSYSSRLDTNASSGSDLKANHKRQLFNEEDEDSDRGSSHRGYVNGESYKGLNDPDQSYKSYDTKSYDSKSNSKNRNGVKSTKKVTFDLPKDRNETMSFDLEMPSPLKGGSVSNGTTPSPVKGVLKNGKRSNLTNGNDSLNLSKPHSLDDSYGDNRQTTSNKRVSDKDSGRFYNLRSSGGSKFSRDDTDMYKKTDGERSDLDVSGLSESFNLDYPSRASHKYNHYDREFDDTDAIQTELDELDISMTPDFTDCMKLLNRAEKKVHSDSRKPSYQVPDDPLMDIYKPSRDLHDNYTSSEPKVDSVKSETGPLYGDYKPSTAGYTDSDNYTSKYFLSSESKYDLPSKQESSYKAEGDIPLSNYTSSTAQISTYKSGGASDIVRTSDLPLSNYTSSSISNYKTNSADSDPVATNVTGGRYSLPFDKTEAKTSSSDKYSIPTRNDDYIASSSGKFSLPTTNVSEKFRSAALDNFGLPSDSGQSKYTGTDIHTSKGSFETGSSASGNLYGIKPASTPDKDFLAARPLTQSGFGRSPSVDNLFMSSKTSTQVSGSRYATAEDIPSDFRSRRSLPAYPSSTETGRLPLSAASDVAPSSRDYVMSSLPPKPVRTRSQSDLGTSVASLASSSAYQRGRGKTPDVVSVPTFSVTNSTDTLPSYSSSSSQNVPTSLSMSYAVPSAAGTGSSSAHYLDVGKYSAPVPVGASIASSLTTNRLTTTSTSLGLSGPVKAKTGYSYTDFDLGVNPKSKSKLDLPLTTRVRSNSLDIPVDKLSSYDSAKSKPYSDVPFDNKASNFYDTRKPSYSYSDSVRPSVPYASAADPESAYAISLTGAPSQPRSAALEDNIPSKAPGMSSSKYSGSSVSSSTSYLPSSLTSVTSSSTYSSTGTISSSSSYQPAYSIPSSSTYIGGGGGKSLDPIHEASSKGYSFLSNNSSVGDISRSDSFLPEPKKRLFDSTDDLDMSLSPIKTTRKI